MRPASFGLVACLFLAACGTPLRDVPRLADRDVVTEDGVTEDGAAGNRREEAVGGPPTETEPVPESADPPRRGLLGFLRGRAGAARAAEPRPAASAPEPAASAAAEPAVPDPEAAVATGAADGPAPARRGGLLGALFAGGGSGSGAAGAPGPGDPDYAQVGPGEALPYGEIARLCGAPVARFGSKSQSYPERGRGWDLYDSSPGSTAPRTFWLTGFDDGCARQFTAALVIFGPVASYEQIRYSAAGATLPVSETDRAYETLKARLCRVGKGKPCGNRIGRMGDAVFVSVYERFGSNPRWKNILLHEGQVLAVDVKTR